MVPDFLSHFRISKIHARLCVVSSIVVKVCARAVLRKKGIVDHVVGTVVLTDAEGAQQIGSNSKVMWDESGVTECGDRRANPSRD
jgi:hypothetical protein